MIKRGWLPFTNGGDLHPRKDPYHELREQVFLGRNSSGFVGRIFGSGRVGLYLYELGNSDVGLAGAGWTARAQDASTVFTNPAGMTRLKKSEMLVGVQPIYMHMKFSPDSNTTPSGKDGDASTWLPAGGLYYVHNLMPKLKIGSQHCWLLRFGIGL